MTGWPACSFAYQPIVDCTRRRVVSYEALIRGERGEGAASVLAQVHPADLHAFDAAARLEAIRLAVRLGLTASINLNFLPQSLLGERAFDEAITVARAAGLGPERLCVEVTETEAITDAGRFAACVSELRSVGVQIAIDDFGAGYSGLNLLADFQPDIVKLDMNLIRGIERQGARQAIVRAIIQASGDLGIQLVAEGIETSGELCWLQDEGVELFQGFLLARPGFKILPAVEYPVRAALTQ